MSKYVEERIKKLERIRPAQDRSSFLRLDMNENPEGLPLHFFNKVMEKITPETISMYPEPGRLTAMLAELHHVKEDNLIITNGSDESIKSIFEVFAKEGTNFVSVHPTFEMYMVYGKMFNLTIKPIEYDESMNVDVNEIISNIDNNTSLVALLNPNNPIGNVYSESEVRRVIEKAKEVGAIVIIDEAYHYFYSKSFVGLINEFDNVFVTRTFSKACSIAGLRIGYAVGSKEIISYLEKVRQTFNVNALALLFAEEILKEKGLIEHLVDVELEGRSYIIDKLKASGRKTYAQNGNYVFFKPLSNKDDVILKLKNNKVLVRGYSAPVLSEYIRISTGSKKAMEKFWGILEKVDKE